MRVRQVVGAAAAIAAVTVAARVVGFGRTAVLAKTLGPSCVGDTYTAANAVPNVVFEVVAGGALAAVVVPLLAAAIVDGDRAAASRTASALLTWTVAVLAPVALLGALAAPLLMRALLGDDPTCVAAVEVGSRMLVVFMPQVVLYGVGVVLAGVLQAHSRFLGPAVGPLLSSLVVLSAYLVYAATGPVEQAAELTRTQTLVLSVGTTLGVAALSLSLLVPLRRCGLRLRPSFAFPAGVAPRARRLAVGGVAALLAQQVALVVALRLAAGGDAGSVVVLTVATAVFLLPWAVLAVPVATSVFPSLAATADADGAAYDRTSSVALRAVLLAMTGAAAVLVVVGAPLAELLVRGAPGAPSSEVLARSIAAFAPGLLGHGLVALLARALYARGEARTATVAVVAGWLTVAAVDVALVVALPDVERVVLLGIGHSVGVTLAGGLLLQALRRSAGPGALGGGLRSGAVGVLAGVAALLTGALAGSASGDSAGLTLLVTGTASVAVFVSVAQALDPVGLRGLLRA